MRIGDVRLRHVSGRMRFEGDFWEERLIRPVDVYPKYRAQGPEVLPKTDDGAYRIETFFVEIESDEGVVGIGGPLPREERIMILDVIHLLMVDAVVISTDDTACRVVT